MDTTLEPLQRRVRVHSLELALREWPASTELPAPRRPFLLVHGLASNARTWDAVARELSRAGHHAVAVDQRGHGHSDKPSSGYGFDDVTSDLHGLITELGFGRPILAGQSWGGNVVLDFATRWPEQIAGLVLVDGGFIELSAAPGATWEQVSVDLRPPQLLGMPRSELVERLKGFHPDWDEEAIEMTLGNLEELPDGTVRPWLSLDNHMAILRACWDQKPSQLYKRVPVPVLIAAADAGGEGNPRKHEEVSVAEQRLPRVQVRWFEDTAHDIHVHRPSELAAWMLRAVEAGYFG